MPEVTTAAATDSLRKMLEGMPDKAIVAMMDVCVKYEQDITLAYQVMAEVVGEREMHAAFTDEALKAKAEKYRKVGARGYEREARILLEELSSPADRAEAADRAWTIQNLVQTNHSGAVHMACQDVKNGRPRPHTR